MKNNDFKWYGGYGEMEIVGSNINLSIFIICENQPNLI